MAARKPTTHKPAAKKAQPIEYDEFEYDEFEQELDFDSYDAAAEEAAIVALAEQVTPDFIIVEGDLVTRFPDKQIIRTPLNIPYATLKPVIESSDEASGQFEAMLNLLGRDADNAILREQGMFSVTAVAQKYFATWQKVQGATLGESRGSSN